MFDCIKNFFDRVFNGEMDPPEERKESTKKRDNLSIDPQPPLKDTRSEDETTNPSFWYPMGKALENSKGKEVPMKTVGYYQGRFPKGAVIHTTAGRSRHRGKGGRRNAMTHRKQAKRFLKYVCNETPYCFFVIDRGGTVWQQFPLDRWGYHAGESYYPGIGANVSRDLVGIEIMSAGKLRKVEDGKFHAWFTDVDKGDKPFTNKEVDKWENDMNIKSGHYHMANDLQKEALVNLLLWLDSQSETFSIQYVVGHDEVSPDRKTDPGGSIGMTMPDFRGMLHDIKRQEAKNEF